MNHRPINLQQKFSLFREQWQPKVIAEMNDYQFKLARLEGDFIWHDHPETDETFVVPKGVRHRPCAEGEVKLMLIEPRGTLNTGHEGGVRTAPNDVWI
jgi:mannose-6-phosphate isomerase-like protein (cupin superfamily)